MITNLYTIYDKKSEVYNRPFHCLNHKVATRTAVDILHDETTEISRHPEDYLMLCIGHYDDSKGLITMNELTSTTVNFLELSAQIEQHHKDHPEDKDAE